MATEATVKEIMAFFGMTPKDMIREWKPLSDKDKDELRKGISDGTLTY